MPNLSPDRLLGERAAAVDVSGIRHVFQLGAQLDNPINFSIGQPDFPVPDVLKNAAIDAIRADRNCYTLTAGADDLLHATRTHLTRDVGWSFDDDTDLLITSGTSGALQLAFMAVMNDTDEAIIPDPYFVIYPNLGPMFGGRMVTCDTAPDFRMTAQRVEPLINDNTRIVLANTPANPTGVVLNQQEVDDLYDLCTSRGVLLVCDEIYDLFCYGEARRGSDMLLIRGLGKNYGCTGWRLGYAAGPSWLIAEMAKFQQYTYVCAPSLTQAACVGAFEVDMSETVARYAQRRDMVVAAFEDITEIADAHGAFYAWIKVPEALGCTATEFAERAVERNVLIIPGAVFSANDTHFRLSYACDHVKLTEGLAILRDMMTA
jgi:aspartate/methionine/tyrosine aminotransferase